MSKLYLSADLHLGHKNIMTYCGRTIFMTKEDKERYKLYLTLSEDEQKKFKISDESLNNHDEGIIKRWNERVKPDDTVIHVGDFLFKNSKNRGEGIDIKSSVWESRLNGKIIFIKGWTKITGWKLFFGFDAYTYFLKTHKLYLDLQRRGDSQDYKNAWGLHPLSFPILLL